MNIEFTRVNNDINGNPRYVCHFLNLLTDSDTGNVSNKYETALCRAKKIGGRKFHNKQYCGGIVFQSYNNDELEEAIIKAREPKTIVIFRKFKTGDILALFPYIDEGNNFCLSYMHVGQHSLADYYAMIHESKPARYSEYKDLENELTVLGYNLTVRQKISFNL